MCMDMLGPQAAVCIIIGCGEESATSRVRWGGERDGLHGRCADPASSPEACPAARNPILNVFCFAASGIEDTYSSNSLETRGGRETADNVVKTL